MQTRKTNDGGLFERVGGVEGIRKLTNCFYDIMEASPEAAAIRDMHPKDLDATRENLALFLSGFLGGPFLYKEKHGTGINLTDVHALYDIGIPERDSWLACMEQALAKQQIAEEVQRELMERFMIPAEKIRSFCQQQFHRTLHVYKS